MVGGAISGYWATGRLVTAMAPASTITSEITAAKIGRSMKNLEILDKAGFPESFGNCDFNPGTHSLQPPHDHTVCRRQGPTF